MGEPTLKKYWGQKGFNRWMDERGVKKDRNMLS